MALADDNAVVVTFNDSTQQAFLLSSLPDVKMENDSMTITAGTMTAKYGLNTVKTFSFDTVDTGIKAIKAADAAVHGDALVIPSEKAKVKVYAVDGSTVNVRINRSNSKTIVDLSSLIPGRVYIINADGKSVKFLK